jgi:mannan endo-1,4-beta-mannosidase
MHRRHLAAVAAAATLLVGLEASPAAAAPGAASGGRHDAGFVTRAGTNLYLNNRPFRFVGTNNYYLEYSSHAMTDDVFARAKAARFTVLRTWGWLDIGNQDGSNSVSDGKKNGIYFQYWDPAAGKPAYNDGADGLENLDYVVAKAGEAGIKLVIPFTNNWSDFGGIDQYVRWAGGSYHDDFYTDPTIRQWYQDYIAHLLNRVNTVNGRKYKDDPTIMTWELGNEPRCKGSGVYPASATCSTDTLTGWVDTMTTFIKSIDRKHLTSVGDEGFYCTDPGGADWTTNCGEGVDSVRFAALPNVDVLSYHLYPDGWGKDAAWGTDWVPSHVAAAKKIGKAVMLGEFGYRDKATRNTVYKNWTDAGMKAGVNGMLYWILSGLTDDGKTLYADYDGFTVYCPSPVCQTMTNASIAITTGRRYFAPVADDDPVKVEFGQPATLTPVANDIGYQGATVVASTIDLDPATPGQQKTLAAAEGTFALNPDGTVTYTPAAGFHGKANATYTVRDCLGTVSNPAAIRVIVKPNPADAVVIASFETDTQGWGPASWSPGIGTVSQQNTFATDGTHGLHVVGVSGGGWFGRDLDTPIDLSQKANLRYDIKTGPDSGTSTDIAVKVGEGGKWCQGNFTWVPQNQQYTFDADLLNGFSCDVSELTDVRSVYIYIQTGPFDLDYVRAV